MPASGQARLDNIAIQEAQRDGAEAPGTDITGALRKDAKENYWKCVPADFSAAEKEECILFIENGLARIKAEYDEFGYYERLEKCTSEMEFIKSEDMVGNVKQKKLFFIATMCEIIAGNGVKQTIKPKPIIQMKRLDNYDKDAIILREARLDDKLRYDCEYERLLWQTYRNTPGYGAQVVKVPYVYEVNPPHRTYTTYTPQDITAYEELYGKKLFNPDTQEAKNWDKLKAGQTVEILEDVNLPGFKGCKPYIVSLSNWFASIKTKDLSNQSVIAERIPLRWNDIEARERSKYYDAEAVADMRKERKDTVDDLEYKIYEATILWNRGEGKKTYRYKVTFDSDSRKILRAIYFPCWLGRPDYEIYNAWERTDSWMGYTALEKLEELLGMANKYITSIYTEFSLAHNRIILTDDTGLIEDAQRQTISINDGEIRVLPFSKGSQFQTLPFTYAPNDRIPFLQWLINFTELTLGVSATLMSGQEDPGDPRAPGIKTAIKFKASNSRIEDVIKVMQITDEKIAEQVEMIYYKFVDEYKNGIVEDFKDGEMIKIPREAYEAKIRYTCQGSILSFNKTEDNNNLIMAIQFLKENYPEVWMDPKVRAVVLASFLNNYTGSIESERETILRPMLDVVKSAEELAMGIENGSVPPEMAFNGTLPGVPATPPQGPPAGPKGKPGPAGAMRLPQTEPPQLNQKPRGMGGL